jgi:hypothetical protein
MNSEFMSTTSHTHRRLYKTIECGCDLVVMIEALQASCPGSNPGVRTSLLHQLSAGVAKHGQRRRT